jgi:hypothetical protein
MIMMDLGNPINQYQKETKPRMINENDSNK